MIRTDIVCRAVPWSRLIQEMPKASKDLNLQMAQKASVALVGLTCALVAAALVWPQLLALAVLAISGVIFLNRNLYTFFWRERGVFFAVVCVPLHLLYYLYSGLSYAYSWASMLLSKLTTDQRRSALKAAADSFESRKS